MKSIIHSAHDLERYGVELLTGEACALSMRILCDVSPEGCKLLEKFFSIEFTEENNSWNHQGIDGWHSFMMPPGMWPYLAAFALTHVDGFKVVVYVDHRPTDGGYSSHYVKGFETEELYKEWVQMCETFYGGDYRTFRVPENMRGALRMQHFFSGRVE